MDSERRTRNENNFQEEYFLFQLFESEPSVSNHHDQANTGLSETPVQYPRSHSGNNMLNGNSGEIKEPIALDFPNSSINGMNGEHSLRKELSIEVECLKKKEKDYLEQYNVLQNQIIGYERKLSELLQEAFSAKNERDKLKEQAEYQQKELVDSNIQINQLKAQIYQLTELKLSQDETDNRVEDLQKKLAYADRNEKKWKKQKENDSSQIKKLRLQNRKQWTIITRFGQKLAEKGLLTSKEKACITKEYDEENPPVSEDFEFDDPTEEISQQAEPIISKANEQPLDVNETINSKKDSTFLQPQAVKPSSSAEDICRKSSITPQNASTLHRPHSFKHSHYFTKTCHEVLDDPLVSDEMDISGPELSAMKQQLGLDNGHFTPISPIPPTPSPRSKQHPVSNILHQSRNTFDNQPIVKGASNHLETSRKGQSQHSQMDSKKSIKSEIGRRLTFTHQQSEGFDVEGDSLNSVDRRNEDESQNALTNLRDLDLGSKWSSYKQRIQAKRQNDGEIKFSFNLLNKVDLEVDYDTQNFIQNITCTLPPPNSHISLEERPSIVNQLPRPTPSSIRIQKPVFIKKEPFKEDDSPLSKKPRIAPGVEPFRLSTLSSKDSGSSGFVSYMKSSTASNEKSEQPICNDAKDQLIKPRCEENSCDFNLFNYTESPFQTSTPVAFSFDTKKTSKDTPDCSQLPNKPAITDETEKSLCAVSTSCIDPSSNELNELNINILSGGHNSSLQTQIKNELPRKISLGESTTFTSPNSVINVPTPVQSMDNIHSCNDAVISIGRFANEHTGYTSSESDQLESSKKFDSVNESLRKRRKKLVNGKESFNAQFIRTKGRKRQSFTSSKKTIDNSSESDTNNQEKFLRNDSCKNPSELIDMDKLPKELNVQDQSNHALPKKINNDIKEAVENVDNTQEKDEKELECLSESIKFKMPQAVTMIMQTKPDISVSLVSNIASKNGILTSPVATENRNGIESYDKNIDNNYLENDTIKSGLFVEPAKVTNDSEKLSTQTNSGENSNAAVEQLGITETCNGVVLCEEEFSDPESSQNTKTKRKLKSGETVSDNILNYPDVLHQRSISIVQACAQLENTGEIQCEVKAKNKKMHMKRTRSSYRNGNKTAANMTCTDTDISESEQKNGHHSTASNFFHAKLETSSDVGEHTNLHFPVNDNGIADVLNDDSNSPKLSLNSSKLSRNSNKTKTVLDSPKKKGTQNFKEIDLNQMVDDSYSLFDEVSVPPVSNVESYENLVPEEKNSEDLTIKQQNSNENIPSKKYEKITSPLPKKACSFPIPEKRPLIVVQTMPLLPHDNLENSFFSSPVSPDPKSPVKTITALNGIDTSLNACPTCVNRKMDDGSTSINTVEVKGKTSPKVTRKTRSKSLLVENTTEVTTKSSKSANINCCIVVDNDNISEVDSDNDSPLIIAEDIEDNEQHNDSDSQETSKMSVSSTSTNLPVRKSKRLKKKASSTTTKKRRQLSPSKKASSDFSKIEAAFQTVEKTKYTDANSKKAMHNLVSVLLDPMHSPDAPTLIFLFVQQLYKTNRNPMIAYAISEDVSTLLHVTENILVSALFQIESKGKARFPNLLNSVILTLYNLVLGKEERFPMFGLAALCRVLTQICKQRNSKMEPLKLCGELLQWNNRFAPYLIASVIGVWPEAFQLSESSVEEEKLFFGAIALGVKKRDKFSLSSNQWKHSETIFSKFLPVPALLPKDIPKAVERLTQIIRSKCFESVYDRDYLLTMPLVILCRVQGWQWAKEVFIETFLRPSIRKCTMPDELNQIGFEFLLNLCAEILYSAPEGEKKYQVITKYFQPGKEDDDFVHMTAGICIFKLHLWKHLAFSGELSDFIGKWHEHERFRKVSSLLIRRSMYDRDFEKGDVIEHTPFVNIHH